VAWACYAQKQFVWKADKWRYDLVLRQLKKVIAAKQMLDPLKFLGDECSLEDLCRITQLALEVILSISPQQDTDILPGKHALHAEEIGRSAWFGRRTLLSGAEQSNAAEEEDKPEPASLSADYRSLPW
jgi:hypothetical protein